jgi:hypothetical protein
MDNLPELILTVTEYLRAWGYEIPEEVKTPEYYQRVLWGDTRALYNGEMEREAFVDDMIRLIDEQLRRAWNEGMRDNDLDPAKDMIEKWEARLQEIQLSELDHVEGFADAILQAQKDGAPIEPFRGRVDMWVGRYDDVRSESRITTAPKDRFEWIYGDTDHCTTCMELNGVIATGEDWDKSGYHPQGPPNGKLECGGWRCQCRLEYTEKPATEGGIPNA